MSLSCSARWVCRGVPILDDCGSRVVAHARMQHEQEFTGRSVGAVNGEAPAAQVRLRTDFRAMSRDDALIIVAPGLRTARRNAACALGLDEFHAARIWKAFFRRIHDLHDVAMGTRRR